MVTLPLVVRSVQPVLQELDTSEEEAAATLGANAWTTFYRIVLPAIRPAIVGGTLLTFARCLGEFGSVVLVAGNVPNKTLTAPVFIFQLANQFRPIEAAAVATVLFALSFVLVLVDRTTPAPQGGILMSAYPQTAEPAHTTDLPGTGRRRLVRAGIVTLCFLYVGVLLLLPLIGIVWTALEAGPRQDRRDVPAARRAARVLPDRRHHRHHAGRDDVLRGHHGVGAGATAVPRQVAA